MNLCRVLSHIDLTVYRINMIFGSNCSQSALAGFRAVVSLWSRICPINPFSGRVKPNTKLQPVVWFGLLDKMSDPYRL